MVPVLSSSRVGTSPAASTARPLIASTLCCTSRSIPATPIAETRAPMVVGIRQTSRLTRITMDCGEPEKSAIGDSAMMTSRNTMVRLASRMFRAISLGVFCRTEPSTRAIIRSTKVWPGSVVILMTTRSESTMVPPVTEDRSPPDSRTTGADSPVIADSLTLATPSTMSPSPGMVSPASQTTRSPTLRSDAATAVSWPCTSSFRAIAVSRVARSVAAWALPRPSATASARLANSTVSHSHTVTAMTNQVGSVKHNTVQSAAPTSTTNITGLCHITLGSRYLSAVGSAFHRLAGLNTPTPTWPASNSWWCRGCDGGVSTGVLLMSDQSFCNGAERQRRQIGQGGDQDDDADEHHHELRSVGRQRAGVVGSHPLPGKGSGQAEDQRDRK